MRLSAGPPLAGGSTCRRVSQRRSGRATGISRAPGPGSDRESLRLPLSASECRSARPGRPGLPSPTGTRSREAHFLGRWPSGALLDQLRLPGVFPCPFVSTLCDAEFVDLNNDSKYPGHHFPGYLHLMACRRLLTPVTAPIPTVLNATSAHQPRSRGLLFEDGRGTSQLTPCRVTKPCAVIVSATQNAQYLQADSLFRCSRTRRRQAMSLGRERPTAPPARDDARVMMSSRRQAP